MIALLFAGCMLGLWSLGWRLGGRLPDDSDGGGTRIADATVSLLGLLLAFTFAMSLGRHDDRRQKVIAQSNAIGDFYTCITLLPEPHRSGLQTVCRQYVSNELDLLGRYHDRAQERESIARSAAMHNRMTELVAKALEKGTPIAVPLTNTLNDVTSAHASRVAAYEEILPWNTQLLLLVSASVAAFLMGHQQGHTRARKASHRGTFIFFMLVSLVIFVVLDLNQPRRGTITVNYQPLERLAKSMK